MIGKLRLLCADERGTSLIEMGIVLPVLATVLLGMTDVSRAYSHKLQLEQAAYRAIEKVQQYQATRSTYDTLDEEAAEAAGVTSDKVTIDFWLECNGARQASYDTNCSVGQTYARWVTVRIQKNYTPMFGSRFFPGANSDGTYTIYGKAGLRTQ